MEYNIIKYQSVMPSYRENLSINPEVKPFFHSDLKDSLEHIVFKEKAEDKKGILERVFADKSRTSKSGVKALLSEIELRESINSHLMNCIEEGISKQNTQLMQFENVRYPVSFEIQEDVSKQKTQLKNNILELEREKRKEYLECWKDLMFLKKYLHSSLKDYWNFVKRSEMLSSGLEELRK